MMLGKRSRQRPPIRGNTSMTELSYNDLSVLEQSCDPDQSSSSSSTAATTNHSRVMGYVSAASSRSLNRRNSGDFVLESNGTFLRTCSLCNRRLAPTRDIYMYRGDSAFCSIECRQWKMIQDEWKDKTIHKKENNSSSSHSTSVTSTEGEKILAL